MNARTVRFNSIQMEAKQNPSSFSFIFLDWIKFAISLPSTSNECCNLRLHSQNESIRSLISRIPLRIFTRTLYEKCSTAEKPKAQQHLQHSSPISNKICALIDFQSHQKRLIFLADTRGISSRSELL